MSLWQGAPTRLRVVRPLWRSLSHASKKKKIIIIIKKKKHGSAPRRTLGVSPRGAFTYVVLLTDFFVIVRQTSLKLRDLWKPIHLQMKS